MDEKILREELGTEEVFIVKISICHFRTGEIIGKQYVITKGSNEEEVRNKIKITDNCYISSIEKIDINKGYSFSIFSREMYLVRE